MIDSVDRRITDSSSLDSSILGRLLTSVLWMCSDPRDVGLWLRRLTDRRENGKKQRWPVASVAEAESHGVLRERGMRLRRFGP